MVSTSGQSVVYAGRYLNCLPIISNYDNGELRVECYMCELCLLLWCDQLLTDWFILVDSQVKYMHLKVKNISFTVISIVAIMYF